MRRRPSAPRDLTFLRALFAESRDDLAVLPPDTRDLIVDMQFREHRRRRQVEHPTARTDVLVVDTSTVGYVVVECDLATVHIVDLAVRVSWRGRGIGSHVLAGIVADADASGRAVRVAVRLTNVGARTLYERHGFVLAGMLAGDVDLIRPAADAVEPAGLAVRA